MIFKISDICNINSSNLLLKDKFEYINYLDTANINEGVISKLQKLVIGKDKIPSRARRKVKKNDILISTVRPDQKHYGMLKEVEDNMIVSTGFAVLSAKDDIVHSEYLYRFLTQESIIAYLQAVGETSTSIYPSIKPSIIGELKINLPSLKEQKSIANIFSTLDDKIQTNNEINKKLEEMAKLIFKQWFLNFQFPNDEGNPYKSSGGEMIQSELGIIPKGWKVGMLRDIMQISSGKRPSEKEIHLSGDYKIPLAGASSIIGYVKEYNYNEPILVIGRVGTHGIVQRFNEKVWVSDNALVIKSKYYEYTNQILMNIDYKSLNRGSTQPLIIQTDIKKQVVLIPVYEKLMEFEKLVGSLYKVIDNNLIENNTLINLKDKLLPKFMSGEMKVF